MTTNNGTNITDYFENVQTDNPTTMSNDIHNINMNSKLINNSVSEICEKMDLRIVRELSLCFNDVLSIPSNFPQHLVNLERLDLSNNNLENLPSSFNLLTKLEHLKMDYNKFQIMPAVLAEIRSLKFISISHNVLNEIPEDLGCLINLEVLDLSYNKFSKLPNSFIALNRLKELNLAGNNFHIIPECVVYGIRNLEVLDVSFNIQIKLNVSPYSKRLVKFYAMNNGLCRSFPRWILTSEFSTLEEINFNETEFVKFSFPKETASLNVKVFSFTQAALSDHILDMLLKNMKKLEKIIIGNAVPSSKGNIFCSVPCQKLNNPEKIKEIYMQDTGLPMVIRSIDTLTNIKIMDLSRNTIAWLPEEFCLLANLETLIIDGNNLSVLPENFGNLVSLQKLLISRNHLSSLPCSMSNLKNLILLDLYENDLSDIPWDIVNMEQLVGLDIEHNFIPTDNLKIRDVAYEILREKVRDECISYPSRTTGFKILPEENENSLSETSFSSFRSEHYYESDEALGEQEFGLYSRTDIVKEDENWDLSDDSTDDFDPTYVCRKKSKSSFIPSKPHCQYFCPEDLHALPVKQEVRQKRGDKREFIDKIVEGQFDDA